MGPYTEPFEDSMHRNYNVATAMSKELYNH